jgi:polysaccharide biosynthesis/export protein
MRTKILALGLYLLALGNVLFCPAVLAQAPAVTNSADAKYVPYRIARGDQLGVGVFGEVDLTGGGKKVDQKGAVLLPLIGDVRVVGLTVVEAQAAIENAYRAGRYLRNPQVIVTVEQMVQRWVSISGKINIPGRHEMPTDTVWTLKDLIIKAGGLQETARGTKVRITRTLPDGKNVFFEKDVESMIKGRTNANSADAAFVLESEDIVYVPEKII